eukprot:GHVN01029607.1.p1 GENE.GHVN01029607.1~~GHVN01029607.1.p1  ORF type:complete len:114 (-),score=21.62 GHVN01029607.1:46-387(-)
MESCSSWQLKPSQIKSMNQINSMNQVTINESNQFKHSKDSTIFPTVSHQHHRYLLEVGVSNDLTFSCHKKNISLQSPLLMKHLPISHTGVPCFSHLNGALRLINYQLPSSNSI